MSETLRLLQTIGETLDGLGVALCVFDDADRTLLWNRTFLKFFPEHAGRVHSGEPYAANLRRFYESRLSEPDMPSIERFIAEGVIRHRKQTRPFAFDHRGLRLWVSSLPLQGIGRIRLWRTDAALVRTAAASVDQVPGRSEAPKIEGAELFDHVPDGVMVSAADDTIVWVNEPFVLMYGLLERGDAVGSTFEDVYRAAWRGLSQSDEATFRLGLLALSENLRFAGAPFEVPLPGERFVRVIAQHRTDGTVFQAHVDISELKRQQRQLMLAESQARQSEALLAEKSALLEATLERMEQGVMMVNADRVVEVCNRRAMELLELPAAMMASKPTFEAVLEYQWTTDEFARTSQELQDFVRNGGILETAQCYERERPNGRIIEVQSVPIEGGGVLRTYTDITERKRSEERIRHIARHDSLTSLANRDVFLESLHAATTGAKRARDTFSVLYIDLDGFKPVNDRHGHAVGDKLLALLAERMGRVVREGDMLARMGGDEFAVLQRGVQERDGALSLAQRLLDAISIPARIEGHEVQVGASIGIAIWPLGGEDADTLLRNADKAMYAAKSAGRRAIRIHGVSGEAVSASD